MSHFYASIDQSTRKTVPTAMGNINSGIGTHTASAKGAISVYLYVDSETGEDMFRVEMVPHSYKNRTCGDSLILALGKVGDKDSARCPFTFKNNKAENYTDTVIK